MYSAFACHASPATNAGAPASAVAAPPLMTKMPPFGGALPLELPPSPSNTTPPPNANVVGVFRPEATSWTGLPFAEVGGGGPPAACATATNTAATSAPAPASMERRLNTDEPPRFVIWPQNPSRLPP